MKKTENKLWMSNNMQLKMVKMISQKYRDSNLALRIHSQLNEVVPELKPNIVEWVSGEPISDIRIGKYCVNAVMKIRADNDFISAILSLDRYAKNPTKENEARIWLTRM